MRGGVSLAVWIGGACAEIDALRAARSEAAPFWAAVVALSVHERVVVDVIAGASAGGLNGALMAASIEYGLDFEEILDTWLQLGQLGSLVRKPDRPAASLLDGDGQLFGRFHKRLLKLTEGTPLPSASFVDLQLTATLVEPVVADHALLLDERDAPEFSARFHFRNNPLASWEAPSLPSDRAVGAARLAMAARATSSFPVAFEAAIVRSSRANTFDGVAPDDTATDLTTDMGAVFSEHRGPARSTPQNDPDDFVVADGGILDNIPLGRAVEAIATAPADRPSERVLLYVQPGSSSRETNLRPSPAGEARRYPVAVLTGLMKARVESENIAQDLRQIHEHNRAVRLARGVRQATLRPLLDLDGSDLHAAAAERWDAYRWERAFTDVRNTRRLLDDPVAVVGDGSFPIHHPWCASLSEGWHRRPTSGWSEEASTVLDDQLMAAFRGRLGPWDGDPSGTLAIGTGALWRLSGLLIELAGAAERRSPSAQLGDLKQALYRYQLFVESVVDRNRRIRWVVEGAAQPTSVPATWVSQMTQSVDRLIACPENLGTSVRGMLTDVGPPGDADSGPPLSEYAGLLRTRQTAADLGDGGPSFQAAVLVPALVELGDGLRTAIDPEADELDLNEPGQLLQAAFNADGEVDMPTRLRTLEILCFPEHVAGIPGRRGRARRCRRT